MSSKIKVGIFGAGRGGSYAYAIAQSNDAELVAICEAIPLRSESLKEKYAPNAVCYTDFDEFLKHDMDAVVLCNFFHQHAPYAIKALKAGKHVMSECGSNMTIAEGVELCRTVEASGKIYMLAENYPYFAANMEMRRIYLEGSLGRVIYAEGEYVHPTDSHSFNSIAPGESHWRNWIPTTYYITHSLGPLMYITDGMPVEVNARAVATPEYVKGTARRNCESVGITLCTMDNGAVYRVTGCAQFAGHGNWYRVACLKGAVESVRGKPGDVWLRYNSWEKPEGAEESKVYTAQWPYNAELAESAGHGGGDFWTTYNFIEAIKTGKQPYFDVYRGVACTSVGILAWRSVLNGGAPVKVPDFKDEADRKKYEDDHYNPDPFAEIPEKYRIPCCMDPNYLPGKDDLDNAYEDWEKYGYKGLF